LDEEVPVAEEPDWGDAVVAPCFVLQPEKTSNEKQTRDEK